MSERSELILLRHDSESSVAAPRAEAVADLASARGVGAKRSAERARMRGRAERGVLMSERIGSHGLRECAAERFTSARISGQCVRECAAAQSEVCS